MQLLDKTGVKHLASAIINKIKKGITFTGSVSFDKEITANRTAWLEKGVVGAYFRMINPDTSDINRKKDFMYINFDGTMFRLCVGHSPNADASFDSVEEVITADFDPNGYIRLDRHTIPEKNGTHDLGSKNWRWRTLYCVNALNTSSKDYKTNIRYINNTAKENKKADKEAITTADMYEFAKNIPLASFDYAVDKSVEKEDKALGFIAEDIINTKVGQEFIFDSENGPTFNPVSYTTALYGAVQELMLKVEQLESQLASKGA